MSAKEQIRAAVSQYSLEMMKKPNFNMSPKKFNIVADMMFRITFIEISLLRLNSDALEEKYSTFYDELLNDREFYSYRAATSDNRSKVTCYIEDDVLSNPMYRRFAEQNNRLVSVTINATVSKRVISTYIQMCDTLSKYADDEEESVLELALGEKFDELYDTAVRNRELLREKRQELADLQVKNESIRLENERLTREIEETEEKYEELTTRSNTQPSPAADDSTKQKASFWRRLFGKGA